MNNLMFSLATLGNGIVSGLTGALGAVWYAILVNFIGVVAIGVKITETQNKKRNRIVKATEELSNEVQGVFSKLYQQANPNGGPNAQGGANGGDTEFHQ